MSQTAKEQIEELYLDCDLDDILNVLKPEYNQHFRKNDTYFTDEEACKEKQVGGDHYLDKIQPWDIIDSWELNFYEGNILKYLLRKKDNRLEDLEKLKHYVEKLIELERSHIVNKDEE